MTSLASLLIRSGSFEILVIEMSRAWEFWLGLPVRPRTWEISWPDRDEL